jgi:dihydrofolate reductase
MTKVFAGMAMSPDGFIARNDGDLSWLNETMVKGEDYGFAESLRRTGLVIVGANTYRAMAGMAAGVKTYVVSHHPPPARLGKNVSFYSGDLGALVARARAETDKDVCVFGGGNLLGQLIALDLVDELTVSVAPALAGGDIRFFGDVAPAKRLRLADCKRFPASGIVVLTYTLAPNRSPTAAPTKPKPKTS